METADKALEVAIAANGIVAGLYQTNAGLDVIDKFGAFFDADNVAGFAFHGSIDLVNHLLGLTGTL
jgi:hypothetical protein